MAVSHTTPSGGNIFADLGFSGAEAENLKIRATLMIQLHRIMQDRKLKQKDAAELFGVSQPRISDLARGKMEEFTIDALVNMLAHAGFHVEVSVPALT